MRMAAARPPEQKRTLLRRGELRSPARCFLCLHFRLRSVGACFARPPSPVGASRTRQRNGHRSFPTPAIDGYSMRATTGRPYTLRITPSPVGASCAQSPAASYACTSVRTL